MLMGALSCISVALIPFHHAYTAFSVAAEPWVMLGLQVYMESPTPEFFLVSHRVLGAMESSWLAVSC